MNAARTLIYLCWSLSLSLSLSSHPPLLFRSLPLQLWDAMCNRIYEVGEWATKEKMLTVEDFEVSEWREA